MVNWCKNNKIQLIIDESFVDFANEENSTIIEQEILNNNKHLYVMKSISKSFGVPGIRLGVLASGNIDTIAQIKKDVSIWNINSFGEFYMQIYEKYKKDYMKSLELIRNERTRFQNELQKIKNIRVIESQANYIMIEIKSEISAKELTKKLLIKHNLFIKDLSSKMNGKQFVRVAVRNTEDNNKLVEALKQCI